MAVTQALTIYLTAGAAIALLLTFPRMVIQSYVLGKTWQLLDEIDDAILQGHLPNTNPAVIELRSITSRSARRFDKIRLAEMFLANRYGLLDEPAELGIVDHPQHLTDDQMKAFQSLRQRSRILVVLVTFTGSWLSLAFALSTAGAFMASIGLGRILPGRRHDPPDPGDRLVTQSVSALGASSGRHRPPIAA